MKKSQAAENMQEQLAEDAIDAKENEITENEPAAEQETLDAEIIEETAVDEPRESSLESENAELKDLLQHTRADFENFRKQTDKQRIQAMESVKYATVLKFLPLVDDMSRALAAYPEELGPLAKSFEKTLANLSLEQIDSSVDTEFDPDYHEAVSIDDADGEKEVILETLRPGYLYEGVVLRPAMVKVTHK